MLSLLRHCLIPLLCVAVLAGCAERAEQRRVRPTARELFPPPSADAQAPASAAAADGPRTGEPSADAAVPAAAGSAALDSPDEVAPSPTEDAPPPQQDTPEPSSADAPPPDPSASATAPPEQPTASLKPPALDEAQLGAGDMPARSDLALEFPTVPAPEAPAAAAPAAAAASAAAVRDDEAAPPATAAEPEGPGPAARIIVSTEPALLVAIQGKPAYAPVEGTKLQRVLNTAAFLVKGNSGNYYLSVYDGFMRATKLSGPWTVLPSPPRVVQEAKARALVDGEADVLAGRPDAATGQRPTLKQTQPRIVVSTEPAALVLLRGEPKYEPVPGTQLSRVTNTDARLFVHRPADRSYIGLAGRWYRAASLEGPWEPVQPGELPEGLEEAAAGG